MPERISPLGRPPTHAQSRAAETPTTSGQAVGSREEHRAAMERRAAEEGRSLSQLHAAATSWLAARRLEQLHDDASDVGRGGWFER